MEKKTKIVASISDRRCEVDFIRSLYEAGMNAARINSAHVTLESADVIVNNVRAVSDKIAIIIDTKGPEIRVTGMAPQWDEGIPVNEGDTIVIMGASENTPSTPEIVYLNDASIYDDVPEGASLLIDDGELELKVVGKADDRLITRVMNPGIVKSYKSVNIPGVAINLPSITERDRQFIDWAIRRDLDFIAHSFVRKKEDVMEVKEILDANSSPIKIISKIENQEGVDNIDEILPVSYGVMVARGDLGVELPAEQIPITQRYIVKKCIESKTPVIIATQMLHSMIHNPRPTRAEVNDIASAIYQKVDAIMLSGETASGDYPLEAVRTMARVAVTIEQDASLDGPNLDLTMVRINNEITAQLSRSAVRSTTNLPIKAIVVDTLSGRTGRYVSAFRAHRPVYAVCYRKSVMRQLALSFGVYPLYQEPENCQDGGFLVEFLDHMNKTHLLERDDLIVVMGGSFGATKGASFMEIGSVSNLQAKARKRR